MNGSRKHRESVAFLFVLAFVVGVAVGVAGCGGTSDGSSTVITLTDADNGKSISAKTGDQIEVVLPGNPTTGYAWTVTTPDADKAVLEQQGDAVYEEASTDSSIVGGGGTYTFTFKAIATGTANPTFSYARPSESDPPAQIYSVTVSVT